MTTYMGVAAGPKDTTMLTTAQIIKKYGKPGDTTNFTVINLPYPMRVAWDLKSKITRMQCHKLVADQFEEIFKSLLTEYEYPLIQELGIDLYGGCYNFRQMRGGTQWSRHSWAIALDLDPVRNQLHETSKTARFARPEYNLMMEIFYANGFCNQGREKGFDFMHFEVKQ